jgi:hypothetical protein
MKQKETPIRREVLHQSNYEALVAAYSSDEFTQRKLVFLDRLQGSVITLAEFEDKICIGGYTMIPRFVKKYWVQYKVEEGFTYNKKTKTIKTWYGKKIIQSYGAMYMHLYKFVNETINMEFISERLFYFMKPGIKTINRLLKGKITNPRDFIHSVIKDKHPGIKVSKELLWQMHTKNETFFTLLFYQSPMLVSTCENLDKLLMYYLSPDLNINLYASNTLIDLSTQAAVLNKKLSYCWSPKRMEDVHSELSREIAKEAFKSVEFVDYGYQGEFPEAPFIQLLTNNKDIFEEGNVMSHCIYSNYERRISNKKYFVLRYLDDDGVRGTVGIGYSYDNGGKKIFSIDQFYGKRNTAVPDEAWAYVEAFLKKEDVQNFFKGNGYKPYTKSSNLIETNNLIFEAI